MKKKKKVEMPNKGLFFLFFLSFPTNDALFGGKKKKGK